MAVTITDRPNNLTPKGQKLIFTATSTENAQTGFKFVVVVKDESGTQIAKYYVPKNPSNILIFDLQNVVDSFVQADTGDSQQSGAIIHGMPHAVDKFMTVANTGCKKYTIEFGEVYGDPLVEYFSPLVDEDIYLFDGYIQIKEGYQNPLSEYQPDDSTKVGFLTNREVSYIPELGASRPHIRATETDYGTLALLNDDTGLISSDTDQIHYLIYDSGGVVGGDTFTINSTYGGELPSSTTAEDKLIYFGALPANVNDADHPVNVLYKPSGVTDWIYYTWQLQNSGGVNRSLPFVVLNKANPCKHTPVMVAWVNTLGAWDYMRFDARHQETIQANSKDYMKTVGTYDGSTFDFKTFDRQKTPYQMEATRMMTLNTGTIYPEETVLLTHMIKSKNVMIYIDQWLPIVVSSKSLKYETEPISKRLTASIKIEIAQEEIC